MDKREALATVLDELKRLKKEGESDVYLSDESYALLGQLREGSHFLPPDRKALEMGTASPRERMTLDMVMEDASSKQRARATPAPANTSGVPETRPELPAPPVVDLPHGDKASQWEWLRDQVLNNPICVSHVKPGKRVVFGVGSVEAEVFFCGEAPGADEEVQGEPFVGPAGQLLTKIIAAMGFQRSDVYIGNIMNWRPDTGTGFGNRPPTAEEMAFCLPFLKAQIAIVQPKVIVALGATAVRGLQGLDRSPRMGDLRGRWQDYEGTPLMITYHPSYLLRNQTKAKKREVWEDMLLVMEKLSMPISEKQRGYFQ